jgi:hypothetical protein
MQDANQAKLSADKTGILSEKLCCICRAAEEQVIDKRLVAAGECAQGSRNGESEHEVRHWQQEVLLLLQPFLGLVVLAFGTVAIAAGVVAVLDLVALRAGIGLPTQGRCAALLNGAHGSPMAGKQPIGVLLAIGGTVLAEDVGQF